MILTFYDIRFHQREIKCMVAGSSSQALLLAIYINLAFTVFSTSTSQHIGLNFRN